MKRLMQMRRDLRDQAQALPRLVVFLLQHLALGFALGIAFAAIIVLTNVANLKGLLQASESPYVAIAMLFVMCGLTFASLVTGAAVMSLPWGSQDD